jgi:hypothetical protein
MIILDSIIIISGHKGTYPHFTARVAPLLVDSGQIVMQGQAHPTDLLPYGRGIYQESKLRTHFAPLCHLEM